MTDCPRLTMLTVHCQLHVSALLIHRFCSSTIRSPRQYQSGIRKQARRCDRTLYRLVVELYLSAGVVIGVAVKFTPHRGATYHHLVSLNELPWLAIIMNGLAMMITTVQS